VHVLTKSGTHGKDGVAKTALSAKNLTAPELPLDPQDIERLHTDR
jgi:hypothetical protein